LIGIEGGGAKAYLKKKKLQAKTSRNRGTIFRIGIIREKGPKSNLGGPQKCAKSQPHNDRNAEACNSGKDTYRNNNIMKKRC